MPAHFEPHYQINADLQLYTGISGESIDFPNRVAAEIDVTAASGQLSTSSPWIYWLIQPPIVPSKRPSQYSRFGPAHPMPRDTTLVRPAYRPPRRWDRASARSADTSWEVIYTFVGCVNRQLAPKAYGWNV